MKTITLNKSDIHKGSLILINKKHPRVHRGGDHKISLIPPFNLYRDILLEMKTATVLTHLLCDLNCYNEILPVSGYRTLKEQESIYMDSLHHNGKKFTEKYVAQPNHSEHQTGLAIDLALKQENIDFIRPYFPNEGICEQFRNKAPHYGFVERYQRGKEKVTGIAHEPWHFRYVGYPHSNLMDEYGLALEEYVEELKQFVYGKTHLIKDKQGQTIEIFYVAATSSNITVELPDKSLYQISGNNMDGFIVTVWR